MGHPAEEKSKNRRDEERAQNLGDARQLAGRRSCETPDNMAWPGGNNNGADEAADERLG